MVRRMDTTARVLETKQKKKREKTIQPDQGANVTKLQQNKNHRPNDSKLKEEMILYCPKCFRSNEQNGCGLQ